jgi:hypothetical protein
MFVSGDITKDWATRALRKFAEALKAFDGSCNGRVWWIIKYISRMDECVPDAVTITDCFGLTQTQEEVFWGHFGKRKWFEKVQLFFPDGACIMADWKDSKIRWVRQKEASDKAPTREPIPEELERSVSAILGVEVVTVKILTNYLRGKKLKSSGTKLEMMNRVLSSSKPGDDTRQDTGVLWESLILACEAGVHHEDDLEPEEDDYIDTRMQ